MNSDAEDRSGSAAGEEDLIAEILSILEKFHSLRRRVAVPFHSGEAPIPYAGRVYDEKEVMAAVRASLDFWLTRPSSRNSPSTSASERLCW